MAHEVKEPTFSDLKDCMSSAELLYGDAVLVREICGLLKAQFPSVAYWFDGGSLIGALRHNSFVPYDDDIDLCVMYDEFNRHLPDIQAAVGAMGYKMQPGKGGKARAVIHGEDMPTYWQVFLTPAKARQILSEVYGRKPTASETKAYLKGAQPYLDFLLVWQQPDGSIQYVGDYYGNQPYHPQDVFPLQTFALLGMEIPIPHKPVNYLKTSYKTNQSPVTHAVIWSEHKKNVKPICNQRLRANLLQGNMLKAMNDYLRRIFGAHLKVTTKRSLQKYA